MLDKKENADFEYERIKTNDKSDSEMEEGNDIEKYQTKGKDDGKWTTRMKLLLLAGCIVSGITYGSISLIMPYFPIVVCAIENVSNVSLNVYRCCYTKIFTSCNGMCRESGSKYT